ncbi:MAG: FAD-dependent oxidoreductase, partial [Clostridium sp.]
FAPVPVEGSEKNYKAELILLAMGFTGSQEYLKNAFGVESDARSNIKSEYGTFNTNVPKIFSTGDARTGQSLVVRAIADGIEAGKAVDKFLRNN